MKAKHSPRQSRPTRRRKTLATPTSAVMSAVAEAMAETMAETMAEAVAKVVDMPDPNQPRPAAVISLRPRSVSIRPGSVGIARRIRIARLITVAGRIGIVRTSGFGTGRETRQQDHQHEESKFTHGLEMGSPRRVGKLRGKSVACKKT